MSGSKIIVLLLVFFAGVTLGLITGRSSNIGAQNIAEVSQSSDGDFRSRRLVRNEVLKLNQDARLRRSKNSVLSSASESTNLARISFLTDGSVIVPASLTDRIRIGAMNYEGVIDPAELALIGIDQKQSLELQNLVNQTKGFLLERQASVAKVIRQDDNFLAIRIPRVDTDNGIREEFDSRVNAIVGERSALIRESLCRMNSLTLNWGLSEQIVCVETNDDGIREYKVFCYNPGYSPEFPDGHLTSNTFAKEAKGTDTYRSEEVPPALRHLLK